MANNSGKIRFVRCPKCLQLLIEYTNVSLYQCGGCGTVLKAKNKDLNKEDTNLKFEEIQNSKTNNFENISPDNLSKLKLEEIQNSNLEIISPDNLSIFSTEPNNTASSSNAHLSESDENETIISQTLKISNPKNFENLKPPNFEKDETLISQSVVSEDDSRSIVSNAYDGSISSSDEQNIQNKTLNKTLILQKSRRTFRKRVPNTSENKLKEKELGLPPRPPINERFNNNNSNNNNSNNNNNNNNNNSSNNNNDNNYTRNEIENGISLDSNDFEIIQSLLENDSPSPSLINKLKSMDRNERLRKMDDLRDQLRKFSIKRGGDSQKYPEKQTIDSNSNQSVYYQKPKTQESPLCFDSKHNNNYNYNSNQDKLPFYPYSPSPSSTCIHCTNTGFYNPNYQNIPNLYAQSSYSNSPRSINQDSIKSSFKDKRSSFMRKHICRPILGATPFIICENCFKLLQIPSTILILKKGGTKLQCGNCSEVLTVPFPNNNNKGFKDVKIEMDPYNKGFNKNENFEIEEHCENDASETALHRLMGYDSATELLHSRTDFDARYGNNWNK